MRVGTVSLMKTVLSLLGSAAVCNSDAVGRLMRRLFLRDTQPGDIIEDVFMISNKQLGATNQGKPYIKAVIGDRTCTMNARMWNAGKDIFQALPDSGFVKLRGRVENYQNNNQFIIEQTWAAMDGAFEVGDLIASTDKDVTQMCAQLQEL